MMKPNFLEATWKQEDYLPAEMYDTLLQPYRFSGIEDLDVLEHFLEKQSNLEKILELGFGTGRSLPILKRVAPQAKITAIDLSETMNKHLLASQWADDVAFLQSDSLSYLFNCDEKFDHIFSLWSLSHSIHDSMKKLDLKDSDRVARQLALVWKDRLETGGSAFVIHFDTNSDEQRIVSPTWSKINPFFNTNGQQSHSLKCLAKSLEIASEDNSIEYRLSNRACDPIIYDSPTHALETYVNFHLEGSLQRTLSQDLADLECKNILSRIEPYVLNNGKVSITPRAFIAEIWRV